MVIPLFWFVFNIIRYYCTKDEDRKTVSECITRIAVVVPLTLALVLVMLSIFPTLLLLFAYPLNTFSLIVIHVALFYTETMAGVLFIHQVYTCKQACTRKYHNTEIVIEDTCTTESGNTTYTTVTENTTESRNATDTTVTENTTDTTESGNTACCCTCNVILALLGVAGMLIVVYLSVMLFYEFLFLRNLSNNLAFDIIIKYIPSVGIAAFGYLIRKGTFSKEDKNEKLWRKLGELLNIPEDQLNTLDDDAKKQEIAKLRSIFGQLLANNDQQPRQPTEPRQQT